MTSPVLVDTSGAVASIVLNKPDRSNAIDLDLARHFSDGIDAIEQSNAKAVLLSAAGKNFCVGGDVGAMAANDDRGAFIAELAGEVHRGLAKLAGLELPVVATVRGAVAGGGLGLMLAADLVVCDRSARFRAAYPGVGLSPDCGVSYWLPRAVGTARALDLLLTNRVLDADSALAWGLVTQVADGEELDRRAQALAARLADGASNAHGRARTLVRAAQVATLQNHLDAEARSIAELAAGPDAARLINDFVTGR